MRTIDVVIVTFRSETTISRCLGILEESLSGLFDYRVLVVDNNSDDGTVSLVRERFPAVTVVERHTNDGFAVATNVGLRQTSAEFVLVLNPDTEVPSGVVEHLVDVLDENPDIGIIGPRLERLDGTFDHAAKRTFPSLGSAARYMIAKHLRLPLESDYVAPELGERAFGRVDAVNGAFMLLPVRALQKIGLLDETFWMYGEDLDWCHRCWDAGLSVAYDGRVTAVHVKGASSGAHRAPRVNWHFHRSMWIFYRRYYRDDESPFSAAVAFLGIGGHLAVTTLRFYLWKLAQAVRRP